MLEMPSGTGKTVSLLALIMSYQLVGSLFPACNDNVALDAPFFALSVCFCLCLS